MSCPACEKNRLEGRRFCTQCGARLIDPEPPVEPEVPAQEVPAQQQGEWQEAPKQQTPEPEVPQQQGEWHEAPKAEAPKAAPEAPKAAPEAPAAAAPVPPVEPEKPKKKTNKTAIALIAVIVALLAAAAVLFATGVISFGGDKADKEDTEEADKEAEDDEDKDDGEGTKAGDAEPEDDGTIEIYSDKDSAIRFRGMEEDDEEYRFLVSMENKSDELASFTVYIGGVNGYALPDMSFSAFDDVEGGDTRNTRISMPKDQYEIYQLGDIELMTFNIMIAPEGGGDYVEETVSFRLDGKDPGDYEPPERRTFTNEQTLIDQDGVLVTVGSPFKDDYWEDLCVMVYFENTVDDEVMITVDNVKANGLELENGGTYLTLPANSVGYTVLTIDAYELEPLELTAEEVTELTADLEAEFWTEWDPFFTGSVTYPVALEE